MCKCNKLDSNMSKRTTRYLKRTIKKNNQEILNDKKHIKLLNESLKYMTDYAISSYNYNNYLVNMISNLVNNDNQTEQEVPEQEVPEEDVGLGINPKDLCGAKKAPLTLVPFTAIIKCSMVMALGALKYGKMNWRKNKVKETVYIEAAMSHLYAAMDGEDMDEESGQSHYAHAMACMAILLDAKATGNLVDDREANCRGAIIKALKDADHFEHPVLKLKPELVKFEL